MNYLFIFIVLLAFLSGLYVYSNQILDQTFISPIATRTDFSLKEGLQPITDKTAKCPNILVKSGEYLLLYNTTDTHDEMPVMFNNLDEYANYIQKQREKGIRCPVLFLQKENDVQGKDVFRIKSTPFNDIYNEPFADYVGMTITPSANGTLSFPPASVSQLSTNVSTYPFYNIEAFEGGMGTPASFNNTTPGSVPSAAFPASEMKALPKAKDEEKIDYKINNSKIYDRDMYPGFDAYGIGVGKYTDLDKLHDSTSSTTMSDNPMDPNWGGTQYTKDAVDSGKYIENNVYPVNFSMPGGVQFYPGLHKTYPDPPNFVEKVGGPTPPYN
jgi:hypothetical protein